MNMEIKNPGALTTVQDMGRFGYMDKGFSPSGAVDAFSMQIANALVGNALGEAVLEATMLGPSIQFHGNAVFAVTGADMDLKLNGVSCPMNRAVSVKDGDLLSLGFARNGCRAYIAVAGGMEIEPVLGSLSTNLKCGLGGFKGRALKAGDYIGLVREVKSLSSMDRRFYEPGREEFRSAASADGIPVLRAVRGPQEAYFTKKGLRTLTETVYTVTNDSNRMACKLTGEPVEFVTGGDIISDGIMTGSIQVSSGGMPIVMLADHQTTGGYAKIGTVISADIPVIGQKKPGEKVRFMFVTVEEAQKLYMQGQKLLKSLARAWK